jgi:hypothetical protein
MSCARREEVEMNMRSEQEILEMFAWLGNDSDDPTEPSPKSLEELPVRAWRSDTFKYGYLMGKLIALEWVLRDKTSADLKSPYDFEDFNREVFVRGGDKE